MKKLICLTLILSLLLCCLPTLSAAGDSSGFGAEVSMSDEPVVIAPPTSASDLPAAASATDVAIVPASGTDTPGGKAPLSGEYKRLGGADRIATAIAVSREGWDIGGSDHVLLANAYGYADALAGIPLAGMLDAPVLLTAGKQPEPELLARIAELGASNVCLLGGTASISRQTEQALAAEGFAVTRLAGEDRYGTALRIAEELDKLRGGAPACVFFASASNYPDALSAGAAAAALQSPILYSPAGGELNAATREWLSGCGCERVYILGGEKAVSTAVSERIAAVCPASRERLWGADRYGTALAVNRRFEGLLGSNAVLLATGESFPDALSGGALAARLGAPVLLCSNDRLHKGAHEYLLELAPDRVLTLGGTGALSDYAVSCLLSGTPITTTTTTTTTTAPRPQPSGKRAYLTFDDGPSANTAKILDTLAKYGVKATFFVIYRPGYEATYRRIVNEGHTLALHSYTHDYASIYKNNTAYWKDIEKLDDYLYRITGVRSNIIRFPGGTDNTVSRSHCRGVMSSLSKAAEGKGYSYFDWNVDSGDARKNRETSSVILSNIKKGVGSQKNVVILMHDAPAKTTTAAALPDIIKFLQGKGYELLPITDQTPPVRHKAAN